MNGVYCLTFPNGKRYVGRGVNKENRGIEIRWNSYKSLRCDDQPKLYNALKKYGPENVKYEVILETCDHDNANRSEMYLIDVWNLQDDKYGYNITAGGEGSKGYIHSQESIEKIRKAKSYTSLETRMKMSLSAKERMRRCGNPNKGLSQETRDKISKTRIERIRNGLIVTKRKS